MKIIVAHIVLLLILVVAMVNYGAMFIAPFVVGVAVGQIVLLGTYASCFAQPLLMKLRWVYRLSVCQWLCLTVPFLTQTTEWPVPLCIFANQVILFTAVLLGAGAFRILARRVIVGAKTQTTVAKVRIIDLFILTLAVAVVIAVGCKFQAPVPDRMLAGFGYVIMIAAGLCIGAPIALLLPFSLSGFLARNEKHARVWISTWGLAVGAIAIYAMVAAEDMGWCVFIAGIVFALFPSTLVFRHMGLRWERKRAVLSKSN